MYIYEEIAEKDPKLNIKEWVCHDVATNQDKIQQQTEQVCKVSSFYCEYQSMRLTKRESSSSQRMTHENVEFSLLDQNEMRVLIIYKIFDDECIGIAKKMIEILLKLNCLVYVEENPFKEINHSSPRVMPLQKDDYSKIVLIIVLGGDGTILYALKQFQCGPPPPMLAFQKGTLGFMCLFELKDMESVLIQQVQNFKNSKQFVVESKLRLHGQIFQNQEILHQYHVLNEFVISRGANPNCLYLEIYINDVLLTVASGDGLIVSTPTGSTAYFLSAGGPIVQNEVPSICIAPICPLSLSFRPIVLPDCLHITIKLAPQSRSNGFISCDGQQTFEFTKEMHLEIKRSANDAKVIQQRADYDYSIWVQNLRKKLSWNKVFTEKKQQKSML